MGQDGNMAEVQEKQAFFSSVAAVLLRARAEAMAAVRAEMERAADAMEKTTERGIARAETTGAITDSEVLELLGLAEPSAASEGDWKSQACDRLKAYLLKLNRGFAFAGRTLRSVRGEDDVADLVFFNRFLRCFVLFGVKRGELTPQDVDQMQRCISSFDQREKLAEENPTIGVILCRGKDRVGVELLLPEESLLASQCKAVLPTEYELERLLEFRTEA